MVTLYLEIVFVLRSILNLLQKEEAMNATQEEKSNIYEQYSKKVKGYLYSQVNDGFLAEDLCEDVFLKVYEKLDAFDDSKASLSTWIFTITRNTLIDYYRVRKVHDEVPEDMPSEDLIETEILNNELLESLADALQKLDKRERDLIILHYYKGEKLKEIGKMLGISYAYVKILHNKALHKLKKELNIFDV